MTTTIDSNVLVAFWDTHNALNSRAQAALASATDFGGLVVPAQVFAELMAGPGRTERFLDSFFAETRIAVDWDLGERVWRAGGRAFQSYAVRRRSHGHTSPRRILTDFLIGAYAAHNGYRLLTLDDRLYRAAFPDLKIVVA